MSKNSIAGMKLTKKRTMKLPDYNKICNLIQTFSSMMSATPVRISLSLTLSVRVALWVIEVRVKQLVVAPLIIITITITLTITALR